MNYLTSQMECMDFKVFFTFNSIFYERFEAPVYQEYVIITTIY